MVSSVTYMMGDRWCQPHGDHKPLVFLVTGREAKWPPGESRKVAPSTPNQRMSLSAALRLLWAWVTLEASKCHQSRSRVGQAWDGSRERRCQQPPLLGPSVGLLMDDSPLLAAKEEPGKGGPLGRPPPPHRPPPVLPSASAQPAPTIPHPHVGPSCSRRSDRVPWAPCRLAGPSALLLWVEMHPPLLPSTEWGTARLPRALSQGRWS